jgi:hypothetical protein
MRDALGDFIVRTGLISRAKHSSCCEVRQPRSSRIASLQRNQHSLNSICEETSSTNNTSESRTAMLTRMLSLIQQTHCKNTKLLLQPLTIRFAHQRKSSHARSRPAKIVSLKPPKEIQSKTCPRCTMQQILNDQPNL